MFEVVLIFLIFKGITKLVQINRQNIRNDMARCNNVSSNGLTWVDANGKMRLTSNNHLCLYDTLSNGCKVLKDIQTGTIVRNFTVEQEVKDCKAAQNKAIREGKRICCVDFSYHDHDTKSKIKGMRFRDMVTGDMYVIREFDCVPFYVNIETGEISDVVDESRVQGKNIQKIRNRYHKMQENQKIKEWFFFNACWHASNDVYYCGKYGKKGWQK